MKNKLLLTLQEIQMLVDCYEGLLVSKIIFSTNYEVNEKLHIFCFTKRVLINVQWVLQFNLS